MMSRLKTLEAKTRASSMPHRASVNSHDYEELRYKDIDNEGEELCHDANLPPEVDLPVEGTEPQSSPSGMSRHSKLNTSSANEKNFLPLVLILRFGRQES
ncbi:hypothetical protein KGM_201948 [Danaus plexippus plexippus]|uniref:Uncharacterized protein n=1 Tax=Danaus plexippus plexippus TaxID=278856 RepID=A0A212EVD0_DANPL|nr:hypothetical protein KGM_201948 [Danaus plexippus plexippus]